MIQTGKKLNGRYQIIGNIGSGGMANVFLAHDLILDRDVAIKVLRFDFQDDQAAIRRFQREALAAVELVHPNIVSVYDVGEEDGLQYLVMEYVKGMDLKRYIQTHYPIPFKTIVDIMEQVLSAVSIAHDHRIIHRDLKPQNILIDENNIAKITDFGIAIALSETSITQTNTMLGSVHYLSPEQARGSMATDQSDIYAVGIILYELLTGNVPFDGESAVTIALKHFQEEIPSVRSFDKNISQSLENIVLHATAKNPIDRYKTADEMAEDLHTVLNPNRLNEAVWQPDPHLEETKILTPIEPSTNDESDANEESKASSKKTQKNKARRKKQKIGLASIIVILVGLLVMSGIYFASGKNEIKVLKVSDRSPVIAKKVLEEAGFQGVVALKKQPDNKISEGRIIKTDPPIGTSIKKDSKITLYVSSGNKKVKLDNYKNRMYTKVKEELKSKNIKTIIKKSKANSAPEGTIIKQSPKRGTAIDPKNDTVILTVSSGPIVIGNYYNYSYNDAIDELIGLGIVSTDQISQINASNDTVPTGYVFSQSPAAGTPIDVKNDSIILYVSTGPAIKKIENNFSQESQNSNQVDRNDNHTEDNKKNNNNKDENKNKNNDNAKKQSSEKPTDESNEKPTTDATTNNPKPTDSSENKINNKNNK